MKFLCDRCKTRYSIGDERVRGKILKIRCKNCANVITVREGAGDSDALPLDASRRKAPTTNAPMAFSSSSAAASGALSAAFSAQMAKPPPALEEEWYVSIDGEQAGPFSLAEAQRWVAGKAYEAELHCWSEGFDDWLPVDKVSHFRGLRKKPAPAAAPPPLPRAVPRLAAVEEEPKPLFAATMAVLEKGSGPVRVPATQALKSNGAGIAPSLPAAGKAPTAKGTAVSPAFGKNNAPIANNTTPRPGTVQGVGNSLSPGGKALAAAFDVHDDAADSMTAVEAPAFSDEMATAGAKPAQMRSTAAGFGASARPMIETRAPKADTPSSGVPMDDNLEIGEVSRVVNLADLAKNMASPPARKSVRSPMMRPAGSAPRISQQNFGQTGPFMPVSLGPNGEPIPSESIVAAVPAATSRRGMIILLAAAAMLLVGVTLAVLLIMQGSADEDNGPGLRTVNQISTERPDEVVRRIAEQVKNPTPPPGTRRIQRYTGGPPRNPLSPGGDEVTDPTKRELEPDEVEDMAAKQGDGTSMCYKRAQRGALGIEIQDLRKMQVTLTVDKEGTVNSVQLSDHGADMLGTCLASRIRGWKFRQSSGTKTFKITLVFQHG